MFRAGGRRHLALLTTNLGRRSASGEAAKAPLPDFDTDVNIHEHKLRRPAVPQGSWSGLDGLKQRTQGSLIPETLKGMAEDKDFQVTAEQLRKMGQVKLTREERKRRQRALDQYDVPAFEQIVEDKCGQNQLVRRPARILQLNIGLYCNQACNHCHVESSPRRKEMMSRSVADRCLELLSQCSSVTTLDLTGGAPELCDEFRYLAKRGREMGKIVIDRCNLTALLEPGQEDLAEFLASNQVQVVASLPCYSAKNVNTQRGSGVFDKSIAALLKLNEVGYGHPDSGLTLDLVYNPLGAFLPPEQASLEEKYRQELLETFGIVFNHLFTITNMPIKRFADFLYRRNELEEYMNVLVRNFNPETVENLMCRDHVSIGYDGKVFDCDFNQQLQIGVMPNEDGSPSGVDVFSLQSLDSLTALRSNTDNHCFGCTAGMGSS
ncbi:uncharacterized protein LOC135809350 [Sycon ciliatum]|uniref:uncharacterized protein LOC135809350 n=1 Tax=Sycon ciliatum TaxID=27933 RepID=UPI0020AE87BA|eukprot:scpid52711/ scgid21294/ 